MNLALWLRRTADIHADAPAVAHGMAVVYRYAELAGAAAGVARWLAERGIQPGDRVGLWMDNHPRYLPLLWGSWWAGAVPVPMNARLHPREAAWILGHSGARLCLTDAAHGTELRQHELPGCSVVHEAAMPVDDETGLPAIAERSEDDPAWLFYTSGTTGKPKGVTITNRNLRWMTMAYLATVQSVQPGDSMLHPAPLSHGSGLYHLPYVLQGGINVIPTAASLDCGEFFALARHWRNASCFAAPTIVRRLVDHARMHRPDTTGLATIVYGGAPMYLSDIEDALAVIGPHFAQIYGQGESPMTISVLPRSVIADRGHPRWRARMASVGFAQPMLEITIRGNDGAVLIDGTTGEVCVRGEVVMAGYWQQPEASAEAIRGGWLYTGDVGRLDDEGFLTLLDRSKDLLISGGNNIYPREIEEALLLHPAVSEVSVIGRPDPLWGESVVAYVVTHEPVSAQVLDAFCLDHLARYKRPRLYRFVASLPKNNYGKVLKTELRAREAASSGTGPL
ncbi:MAG: AMP-binding protein [Rhodoferax sp.]|nr:AMP-binding protein [Rhodoferax sp.]